MATTVKFYNVFRINLKVSEFFVVDIFPLENYPYFYPLHNLNQIVGHN